MEEQGVIKSSFLSNLIGLYQRTIIVTRTPEAQIKIGNNVGISGATITTNGYKTAIGKVFEAVKIMEGVA